MRSFYSVLDYLGFVKDYIHVHARMKNYIMYMALYVQANSTEKKRHKKGLKQNNRVMDTNH